MVIEQLKTSFENLREIILLNSWTECTGRRIYRFVDDNIIINGKMVGKFKISSSKEVLISFFSLDFEVRLVDSNHINLVDHFGKNSMKWTRAISSDSRETFLV